MTLSFNAFAAVDVETVECPNCQEHKEIALYGAASIFKREEKHWVQFPYMMLGHPGLMMIIWTPEINQIFVYSKGKTYLVEMKYFYSKNSVYGFLIPDFTMSDVWLSEVDSAFNKNWPFDNDHIGLIVDGLELEEELDEQTANISVASTAIAEGIRAETVARGYPDARITYYEPHSSSSYGIGGRRVSFKIVEM